MRTSVSAPLFVALFASGCFGLEPLAVIGDQCDINTDCQAPLVCALGRCRNECEASRDCALGLRCIQLEELGVCQLPDEANCTLNSECPEPLVCFMPGGCLPMCVTNEDCAAGETCEANECVAPEIPFCVYDSDCAYPDVCEREQCRRECTSDFDCEPSEACVQHESCNGPCMCRIPCTVDAPDCPLGTECVECGDLDCGAASAYCERPDPG